MKFTIRYSDQVVGVLVILALAILIFAIFMLGRTQRWFAKDYEYKTYFNSAQGISSNMAIQYKGFSIGNVKKISLAEDDRVEVIFIIFEEYLQRVREGSLVEVQVSPIGLGNTFIFHPGLGNELIPEGMVIPAANTLEAKALIASGLASRPDTSGDSINSIINQINTFLNTFNETLRGSEQARELPLGQIIGNIEKASFDIVEMTGTLSVLLRPIVENIESITTQIDSITAQIDDPSGTVSKILDGEGSVYSSLEKTLISLSDIIKNLNKVVEFVPSQLPQIGILISQINVIIYEIQDVITAITNNPLLKGGIPVRSETVPGGAGSRDMDF